MFRPARKHTSKLLAVTLVELMVVISILGLLTALAATILPGVLQSWRLQNGTTLVIDSLALARQGATAFNNPIEVRFYQSTEKSFIQCFRTQSGQATQEPFGRTYNLPEQVTFSTNALWSTLLSDVVSGAAVTDGKGTYHSFRFMPDGSTDLGGNEAPVLTLLGRTDTEKTELPSNFYTIRINPKTGITQIFHP